METVSRIGVAVIVAILFAMITPFLDETLINYAEFILLGVCTTFIVFDFSSEKKSSNKKKEDKNGE